MIDNDHCYLLYRFGKVKGGASHLHKGCCFDVQQRCEEGYTKVLRPKCLWSINQYRLFCMLAFLTCTSESEAVSQVHIAYLTSTIVSVYDAWAPL